MNFTQAIGSGFSRYVDFSSRSSRSEYWWWVLFAVIAGIVSQILDAIVGTTPILNLLTSLALLLPGLAVAVRRLHDIDRSGWWLLIVLIPVIGWIVLLIWAVKRGDDGVNRYGPDARRVSIA